MSENGKRPHITVVGDLILDRYLIGDATKLNPEQPGVVIRVDKEEDRLGGAAAVAMIAAGFGAKVTLAGVVGDDEPGNRLRALLHVHGIESHVWVDCRPTTWKQRIVTRAQLRPDRCDREVTTPVGPDVEQFLAAAPLGDILLVSDYGKGVCTSRLLQSLGWRARRRNSPILVDPAQGRSWAEYGRVTFIKANWSEATEESGWSGPRPLALARTLSDQYDCHVVITLGCHGLVCGERGRATWHLPAVSTEVRDVCGAGDTVLATIGVAISAGVGLREVCKAAMAAAAAQIASIGVTVTRCDLPRFLKTAV